RRPTRIRAQCRRQPCPICRSPLGQPGGFLLRSSPERPRGPVAYFESGTTSEKKPAAEPPVPIRSSRADPSARVVRNVPDDRRFATPGGRESTRPEVTYLPIVVRIAADERALRPNRAAAAANCPPGRAQPRGTSQRQRNLPRRSTTAPAPGGRSAHCESG